MPGPENTQRNEQKRLKNTLGLAVCGGESKRMGVDKSQIDYHGKKQYQVVIDILATFCEQLALSCRAEQAALFATQGTTLVPDAAEYAGSGPIGGLLSVHDHFPDNDLLVLGCDYPFMTTGELALFLTQLDEKAPAHIFYSQTGFYEPLIGWYSAAFLEQMKIWYAGGQKSIQQMLRQNQAARYSPQHTASVISIDTPEEAANIRRQIEYK